MCSSQQTLTKPLTEYVDKLLIAWLSVIQTWSNVFLFRWFCFDKIGLPFEKSISSNEKKKNRKKTGWMIDSFMHFERTHCVFLREWLSERDYHILLNGWYHCIFCNAILVKVFFLYIIQYTWYIGKYTISRFTLYPIMCEIPGRV